MSILRLTNFRAKTIISPNRYAVFVWKKNYWVGIGGDEK